MVNNLFTKMERHHRRRHAEFLSPSQIDMQIMKDAAILPGVYAKSLLYRPPSLTNVYVQTYYGMYNYAVLGVKS